QLWVRPTTSCALTTTGRARCWGSNFFGQLGDGTTSNASVPVGVVGPDGSGELSGIRQLTVGAFHTCAVMTNGRVTCWGANFSGQLGDGSTTNRPVPVTVAGLDGGAELLGVIDAVGGGFHTCARTTPGQVRCWGSNFFGQLGDGTTDDARTPVRVRDDSGAEVAGIEQFSAGEFHVCGTQTDGPLRCWGGNFFGQLGDQSITDRPHPVAVQAVGGGGLLTGAVQVTAGGNHSCALLSDDRVTCWGGNGTGQLGDGTVIGRTTPTLVAGIDGIGDLGAVAHVTAGAHHTCVIHTDTRLTCWGDNGAGQLGDGTTVGVTMPIRVATDH
ncbi:MAG: RCC1 repeat-containing protein, partial [Actinomycetota bacterium]